MDEKRKQIDTMLAVQFEMAVPVVIPLAGDPVTSDRSSLGRTVVNRSVRHRERGTRSDATRRVVRFAEIEIRVFVVGEVAGAVEGRGGRDRPLVEK